MIRDILLITLLLSVAGCQPYTPYDIRFLNTPCIQPYEHYDYRLQDAMMVKVNDDIWTIPAGFITDLASIPRITWPIISPSYSALMKPAILHDYLYHNECMLSRRQADLIFFHSLLENDIYKPVAYIMYLAVRVGGWSSYGKSRC